eukprot:TRINITY_DN14363_c0_g1_i1.p1 TRINITY_DN14363_c0_g1~~TRINITY_DN14363_c0_g1_i1.p1  ORF type:complete len:153 (+),score=45.41 TRINITY_DN14363_c0_g1_i1:80-538(+)
MSFDSKTWSIFTCERVFKPPILGSIGGSTEERLSSLQTNISFPSFKPPNQSEKPLGLSLAKTLVTTTSHIFIDLDDKETDTIYNEIRNAIEENDITEESKFILDWLKTKKVDIKLIIVKTASELLYTTLLLNLLTYYNEQYPNNNEDLAWEK